MLLRQPAVQLGELLELLARRRLAVSLEQRLGEVEPDLVCLGKGLGGGLPVSAVIGRKDVMQAWQREAEVVHTSTFAGAPLAYVSHLQQFLKPGTGVTTCEITPVSDSPVPPPT